MGVQRSLLGARAFKQQQLGESNAACSTCVVAPFFPATSHSLLQPGYVSKGPGQLLGFRVIIFVHVLNTIQVWGKQARVTARNPRLKLERAACPEGGTRTVLRHAKLT